MASAAAELAPLPEPLSLQAALALARDDLPLIELAEAGRESSAAGIAAAVSLSGVQLKAEGRLRAVRPVNVSPDRDNNDSSARLALSKRLYDFGYSEALQQAARYSGEGSEWRYLDARQQSRLEIMRRFFDVVLADLQFARDNEAMAGAFIKADRARDRHELNKLSDIDLLKLEAAYQEALHARAESQGMQRAARSRLAIAMGRPGELVASVLPPPAPDTASYTADFDKRLEQVLLDNPELQALRAEVEAARASVEAARNSHNPVLSAELEAAAYNRKTRSTHPLGGGLLLEVPLLTGGARDAGIAGARAALRRAQAELAAKQYALQQQVLDLHLRLDALRLRLEGLRVRGDYRELYLDRSRALYELEVRTDLGDAMTEISALRLDVAEAEFDWMIAQATLDALAGRLLPGEQP